jgi:hypothetical protein
MFQFVVLLRAFCASVSNDRPPIWPVTIFSAAKEKRFRIAAAPWWQNCNRNALLPVIANGVDALSTTWMILMQARWLTLRSSMMMRRLAHWFGGYIRLWSKWSARTVRAERRRRIFAK